MAFVRPTSLRVRGLLLAVPALVVLLSACGGSGYRFVGDGDALSFKVPSDWTEFDRASVLEETGLNEAQVGAQFTFLTAYDADEEPALTHVLSDVPDDPTVLAYVRELPFGMRDEFSLRTIRNLLYPIDQIVNDDQGVYLNGQDLVLEGGLRGSQDIFEISGGIDFLRDNEVLTVNQLGVVDAGTERLYFIAISCNAACYMEHKGVIEEVARSWAVTEE